MAQRKPQKAEPPSLFAQDIMRHWKENFPKETLELEKAGLLRKSAEAAAERAGLVLEQCAEKEMRWFEANELAAQEWGKPPNA